MNNSAKTVALFPGQGAFYEGVLAEAAASYPEIKEVYAQIDPIVQQRLGFSVSELVWGGSSSKRPNIQELLETNPDGLQLAIYATSVATFKILEARGFRPDVVVGHSFGEIAALVCASAFSIAQGAEIVCHRILALRQLGTVDGLMAATSAEKSQIQQLVAIIRNPALVVAVENSPTQTVISGPKEAVLLLGDLARTLKIAFTPLNSPYPFHSPLLQTAVSRFAKEMSHLQPAPFKTAVYSPILERYYTENDNLVELLAQHFTLPVKFANAIEFLAASGAKVFVECGALDTLGKLVKANLKNELVTILAALDQKQTELLTIANLEQTLIDLAILPARPQPAVYSNGNNELFTKFWAAHGSQIMEYIRREFSLFEKNQTTPVVTISQPSLAITNLEGTAPLVTITETLANSNNGVTSFTSAVTPSEALTIVNIPSRDKIFSELVTMYALALEYPEEVFTEEVDLEAELGIDSVKQTEIMSRVREKYGISERPANFKLSDYNNLGKIIDFVVDHLKNHNSNVNLALANSLN